jgi:ABC-2 type transport system permease protein
MTQAAPLPPLLEPDASGGLLEVFRRRYLLRLLVRRELRARYKSSMLGLGWSYVRPAVYFCVYFFIVGYVLGAGRKLEDFAIYLFSGMVLVNLFNEILHSATRSVTGHAALVRKIFLPREMFPVASVLVSLVHFVPGLVILLVAAVPAGWRPDPGALLGAVAGFAIIVMLGLGAGLLLAAGNVFLRDLEQAVDVTSAVIMWSAPVIYPWTFMRDNAPGWVLDIYLINPLVTAVSLFQRAFWQPGVDSAYTFPPGLGLRTVGSLAFAVMVLAIGQQVFAAAQRRFGQEL